MSHSVGILRTVNFRAKMEELIPSSKILKKLSHKYLLEFYIFGISKLIDSKRSSIKDWTAICSGWKKITCLGQGTRIEDLFQPYDSREFGGDTWLSLTF